jgi:4-amino-4-deoxy-L-arabinose transferase-like glycosyltransferase
MVDDQGLESKRVLGLMVAVLLLAAALAWHDLGTREVLGRDENATITKLDQPSLQAVLDVTHMKVTGQPGNMQPLYFLLEHLFWPAVGRSAFMLRFLSSVYGLLAVVLTCKLGGALWNREVGLVGALFTALLPLHVRYSQIARPYTLLALLSLASAYFLVVGLKTNRFRHWVGFVLTATLGFYTHYNMLMVLAAEGLFAGMAWLAALVDVLRKRESARRLVAPVLCFLMVGLLCTPGLLRLARLAGQEAAGEASVALSLTVFRQILYKIGLTGTWRQVVIVGLMVVGFCTTLYRRRWRSALFVALWLIVPFVVLSAIALPRPFVERYVIFVPPVALLLAGQGVVSFADLLIRLGQRREVSGNGWAVHRSVLIAAIAVGLALLFAAPLRAEYGANRAAHRLDDTLVVVERHARAGDVIVVSPRFPLRSLNVEGAEVLYLTEHLSSEELDALMYSSQRMWILYTSYLPAQELQEAMDQWVQARQDEFIRVPIKAITALGLGSAALTDDEEALSDWIVVLEDLAAASAGRYEAWQRHDLLADAYERLSALYKERGEFTLAAEHQRKAEEARAAAPPPW